MKLFDNQAGPNPRRVRIFLAEKGLPCPPRVDIDIMTEQHKTAQVNMQNPWARIPYLEFDDGTVISESVAICRYFEELYPTPPMFGTGPLGRAQVEMWNRRAELGLLNFVAAVFRHTHPRMAKLEVPQVKDWADAARDKLILELQRLNASLQGRAFLSGDSISVADITGGVAMDMLGWARVAVPADCGEVTRWHESLKARPSWSA